MATGILNAIATGSSSNGTSYVSGAFTPVASDYLLVFVHASDTTVDGTLTDSQGLGWDKLTGVTSNTNNRFIAFKSQTSAAASSMTVTWDCTGDAATGAVIGVMRVSGTDGNIRRTVSNSGAAAVTPSVSFASACLTTSGIVFATANLSSPHGTTAPTGYIPRVGVSYLTPTTGLASASKNSGETGTSITAGGLSPSDWTTFGIEFFGQGIGITHAGTGVLVGAGSAVSGTSTRFRAHNTSAVLTSQIGSLVGTSAHKARHTTSGALAGQGATLSGASTRLRQFASSGVLTGQIGSIVGSSAHKAKHTTSGVLDGQTGVLSGSFRRYRQHTSSGVVPGSTAQVDGVSERFSGAVTHSADGAFVGQGSIISGSSVRFRTHESIAALLGQAASLDSVSTHRVRHDTSGILDGQLSLITGASTRFRTHLSSSVLSGGAAILSGDAARVGGGDTLIPSSIGISVSYLQQSIAVDLAQPTMSVSYEQQSIEVSL